MEIKSVISNNLVKLRKQNKLTQMELAEKLSYSDKAVSRWENGEVVPDIETLHKICLIYEIPIAKLFDPDFDAGAAEQEKKQNYRNKIIISLLAVVCVWFFAISIYTTFKISFDVNIWIVFIFAIPLSFLVSLIFNSLWGKRTLNFVFISCLVWTAIAAVCINFLQYSIWPLFILGAPIQVAVILWSQLKKSG